MCDVQVVFLILYCMIHTLTRITITNIFLISLSVDDAKISDVHIARKLTASEISKINQCEDLLSGSQVAALKTVCMRSRTGRGERDPVRLKNLWCQDSIYRDAVQKCIEHKVKVQFFHLKVINSFRTFLPL